MVLFDEKDLKNVEKCRLKSLDTIKIFVFILMGFLTFGLFWLLAYWISDLKYFLYRNESDIWKADYILFYREDK